MFIDMSWKDIVIVIDSTTVIIVRQYGYKTFIVQMTINVLRTLRDIAQEHAPDLCNNIYISNGSGGYHDIKVHVIEPITATYFAKNIDVDIQLKDIRIFGKSLYKKIK